MADDASDNETKNQGSSQVASSRQLLADIYTFVRSRKINQDISGFTLDHYLEEAKQALKGEGRAITGASSVDDALADRRPAQLEALTALEEQFKAGFDQVVAIAEKNAK